ncbi:prolyl oligopeptidase family serine peptidase [Microlunatus panaciterrae]|uniref:prolyl oligopeptidase n=1 Tax=Microlunatus panaciterrae TaxID=400768 RepID=A0ABS2RLV8_9ACTN|nr:prolyl oligopeptidase family serine peptidase [Microlunatus panaciterrae]MBM7799572.1 prolyl oligopeptidase [Microlunatus panaciterrae]
MPPSYPESRRADVVEDLHGLRIADPYRWLEDPDAPETADWVRRQNAVTDAHLAELQDRDWFRRTMGAIVHRPRAGVPQKKGGWYFVSRNDGLQAQDVWYVAATLDELLAGGRVIIDPNTLSDQGTDSVSSFTVSADGCYLAYTVSEGGSDWQTFRLLEVATGQPVDDVAIQTKFSSPTWLPDSTSYLYTDFSHAGHAAGTQTAALGGAKLRLHRLGQQQDRDELILEFPENDQLMFWPELSHDHKLVVVTVVEGTENRNRLWVYRVEDVDGLSRLSGPVKLIDEPVAEFSLVRVDGSVLYLSTDLDAPRGRIVRCDLDAFEASGRLELEPLLAEGGATLQAATAAGDVLVTFALQDATPKIDRYALDGRHLGPVEVPGGSVVAVESEAGDSEAFIGMSSVTSPTRAFLLDPATGTVRGLDGLVPAGESTFSPPEVTVQRRSATSADGTAVPYFLIAPAGTDLSRPRPTLLYGYGGFKIPVLADYRPGWSAWLAAGGVLAIANLRGGGEFGSDWYDQGRLANKQNVFDDFIAVGEHLKQTGVTTTGQLALHGRSNGGLLVGAVMTQRPDLAAVALPGVGVLDLLRFHKFTIGAAWISDYGNPDDPDQFQTALAYSPLHNVRPGTSYPATLVLTGDHDDRVVPLHSHKFTAALQHAHSGQAPVLTRVEVATGHGMGKPTQMVAAEWADLLAFAAHHTGLRPAG